MTPTDTSNQQRERQFVAAVCASISHEIKNCLAIINENAGLMEDLAMLAAQGRPVDPERHTRIAQVVKKHVRRADQLVRNLNRFAHSGDVASREIDLADTIHFAVTLFDRTAQKTGRRLTAVCEEGVTVETAPLGLLQLLWGLFSAASSGAGSEELPVETRAAAGRAQVRIPALAEVEAPPSLADVLYELAGTLGGELKQSAAEGIVLDLPLKDIGESPALA